MTTSDREPQYLGTHRGVSRVQIGWTTLYLTGDAYTHAIGNLYGTHEQPAREEIAAARKAIPVKPRPPTMTHAPGEERKPSRPHDKAPKPAAKPAPSAKKSPAPSTAAPAKARPPLGERKPKAKKSPVPPKARPAGEAQTPSKAPISTMTDLKKSITASTPTTKAKPISTMAELEARL
jgi:hypothetical protein